MSNMPNSGRIWLVFVGLTFVGMGVFGRIVYIQTVEQDKWQARGEQFSTSVRTIEPARGQIWPTTEASRHQRARVRPEVGLQMRRHALGRLTSAR